MKACQIQKVQEKTDYWDSRKAAQMGAQTNSELYQVEMLANWRQMGFLMAVMNGGGNEDK